MSEVNYRQQWAEGEIEAGTLLDAIDTLAAECERWRQDYKEASADWQSIAIRMGECKSELAALAAELAALKGGQEAGKQMPSFVTADMAEAGKDAIRRAQEDGCSSISSLCYVYAEAAFNAYTAPPAQASACVPEGYTAVLTETLGWLLGERGEFVCPPSEYFRGNPTPYFWRKDLRAAMLASAPTPGASDGKEGDV